MNKQIEMKQMIRNGRHDREIRLNKQIEMKEMIRDDGNHTEIG
jgi:hypothetical protein